MDSSPNEQESSDPSGPKSYFWIKLKNASEIFETASKILEPSAKYGYLASLGVGLWLLNSFTRRATVPFPQPDAALLISLTILSVACFVGLVLLAVVPLTALISVTVNPELKGIIPEGESWRRQTAIYVKRYALVFGPFIAGIVVFLCIFFVSPKYFLFSAPPWAGVALSIASLIGMLIGVFCARYFYNWGRDPFLVDENALSISGIAQRTYEMRARLPQQKLAVEPRERASQVPLRHAGEHRHRKAADPFLKVTLPASSVAWFWTIYVLLLSVAVANPAQASSSISAVCVVAICGSLWHLLTTGIYIRFGYKGTVCWTLVLILFVLVVAAPQLGGMALRLTRLGGGLPISLILKNGTLETTGSGHQMNTKHVNACLVLWIGTQMTIQTVADSNQSLTFCDVSPTKKHNMYKKDHGHVHKTTVKTAVHTISRADILDIQSVGTWR